MSCTEEFFNYMDLIAYSPGYEVTELFRCSKCDAEFDCQRKLRKHTAVMHAGWPLVSIHPSAQKTQYIWVCSLCYRQYDLKEDLRGHMIEFHKYEPAEESSKCNNEDAANTTRKNCENLNVNKSVVAAVEADVRNSEAALLEMRPLPFKDFRLLLRAKMLLRCPVSAACTFKFETAEKAEAHKHCHEAADSRKPLLFRCSECSAEFPNWRRCSSHLWKLHQRDVDLLRCPICDFKSHASVLVWRHMRAHKKWRPRVLKSLRAVRDKRQRQATATSAEALQKVSPEKLRAKKNKYYAEKTCEICSRKFVNGKTLSKHVKSVHNKIKPFICNICGKKMARKASLIIHMRQHTRERPLQCPTCKFATRDPSVLKKHQMRHDKTGKHKCSICDYTCIQTNVYKRHMRLNHPEEYKKISCNLCNYVTISEERLNAHKEDHRKGLIVPVEDSQDAARSSNACKNPCKQHNNKQAASGDISTDYLLRLESVDSLPHEPAVDTGGVTIPAPSEDTQFPTYLNN